jgi:heat shock protein HslJ
MKKLFSLPLLLGVVLIGCTRPADKSAATAEQLSNIWVLQRLQNQTLDAGQFARGLPQLVINESQNQVSGHTGCNRMSGTLTVRRDHITFSRMITTKMACAGKSVEQPFLTLLNDSTLTFKLQPGTLTLLKENKPVVAFRKAG